MLPVVSIDGEQNYADLLAIASLIALIRIGSFSKLHINAETASLIALDIAAGDPGIHFHRILFAQKPYVAKGYNV